MRVEGPIALFFCGLACSGKSTVARYLEERLPARRYSVDEHIRKRHRLGPFDVGFGDLARETRERFWRRGHKALQLGEHALFDWSLWSRARRGEWTSRAEQAGYEHLLIYLDVPLPVLRERLEQRNRQNPEWAVPMPIEELDRFAKFFEEPRHEEGVHVVRFTQSASPEAVLGRLREELGRT